LREKRLGVLERLGIPEKWAVEAGRRRLASLRFRATSGSGRVSTPSISRRSKHQAHT
jgi:hypothetical protein